MFWKTYDVLKDRLDYTKNEDGSWTAEFNGGVRVSVVDSSLERCRWRALEAVDEHLAAIVTGPSDTLGTRPAIESRKPSRNAQKRKP